MQTPLGLPERLGRAVRMGGPLLGPNRPACMCLGHVPDLALWGHARAGGRVHGQPGQVRGPAAGPHGQGLRGAVAPLPRGLLPLRGQLREGGGCKGFNGHPAAGTCILLSAMCRRLTHAAFPGAQDLLCLGRPLADSIIVDNSPHSYVFQPENALPIGTFIDDPNDREARA